MPNDIDFAAGWHETIVPWSRWFDRFFLGRLVIRQADGTLAEQQTRIVQTPYGPKQRALPPPPGAIVGTIYENPKLPSLPATLGRLDDPRIDDYDRAAPWPGPNDRAWINGFDGKPMQEFVHDTSASHKQQRETYERGTAFAQTTAGIAYKAYIAECRAVLKKAGWSDEEIP